MAEEKILFVDDEEGIRETAQRFLTLAGYTVTTAAGGAEALQACGQNGFALVFTDLKMPGMDGEELLRRIKELSPITDVVIVTAYPTLESAIQTLKAGAYDYLLKPFELADLERTAERCLEKQRLTKDLDLERQLRQKFEELSRLKSEFLANISHELRTPLSAIIGYTDLLLEEVCGQVDGEAREFLQRVSRNSKHLLALIDDLLDLSRIEAGKLIVHRGKVDLKQLLTQVAEGVPALLGGKPLRFISEVDPGLGEMDTDPSRLEQILDNLLDNAIKFTPQGEIRLTAQRKSLVGAVCEPPAVEIAVSDTGIGVPRGSQEIIFNEFCQVDASVTRQYEGLGLGLAICKRLVTLLGGSIEVESEVGKGSTFRVTLPLEKSQKLDSGENL